MAADASRGDGTIETVIREFVPRRLVPVFPWRVVRKRCLKQVIPAPDDVCIAVDSGTDYVLQLVRRPEDFLPAGIQLVLALIEGHSLAGYLEMAVQLLVEDGCRGRHVFQMRGARGQRHRAAHSSADVVPVNFRVATGARSRAGVRHSVRRVAVRSIFRRAKGCEDREREKDPPHHACNFSSIHRASFSEWQSRQALGLSAEPKRWVISALGISSI